jgi:hypothetical protein
LLQRLRLQDEERRKQEAKKKQDQERQEEEMRRKREAGALIWKNASAYGSSRSVTLL